ncbi:MAG: alkaline phosphatase D family protein [Rhodothermales bacterium]
MTRSALFSLMLSGLLAGCFEAKPALFTAQGVMVGEVTASSAILQSRLTAHLGLVNGDVQGTAGIARFHWWTSDTDWHTSDWVDVDSTTDYIVKVMVRDLEPGTRYQYRVEYGLDANRTRSSAPASFRTLHGDAPGTTRMVITTGMNYYHFHFGRYDSTAAYAGPDKHLGYPALAAITDLQPDYFVGTGDNVYFDHPAEVDMEPAIARGQMPAGGWFGGKAALTEAEIRRKYHLQFVQPRFVDLFAQVGTYWEKDDHDHRVNDSDPHMDHPISHELGVSSFIEQLPLADPAAPNPITYRTHRMSRDLQVWFLEGRDYRSPNTIPDGPGKTIWGTEQREWLQRTLLASDATFKIIISPTPLVGPDDAYKRDNHTNPDGFRHEGDAFFDWLVENGFVGNHLYLICGDRHWQYHATHPSGIDEFSTGALVDNNARAGRLAGDPNSTDPDSLIVQHYIQGTRESATGGFLMLTVTPDDSGATAKFQFFDEQGSLLYENTKTSR